MAGFNPSEPRVGAGSAAGGQWGGGGAPATSARSAAAKKAAATRAASKAKGKGTGSPASHHGMGPARNAGAAGAQDAAHQAAYDALMAKPAAQRAAYLKGLSDAELEKATEAVYSFRSTDPDVVRARVACANESAKRGIDIRKHGALGGGSAPAPARKAATPAQARAVSHVQARKAAAAPAKAAPRPAYMTNVASQGGTLRARAM